MENEVSPHGYRAVQTSSIQTAQQMAADVADE
jgi:hypothetical protein